MFYYQLGRIKREKKLYFEAFEYYQKAIGVLQSIYCIERIIQVNIEIANALLSLELYDQAETKYLALLAEAQKNGLRIRACVCLNNLSYLYLINKEYDKCQEFAYKAKKAGSIHHDLNYYLAYCAYKTRPYKEARKIVSKLLKDEDNRHTARMMKMIQGFINDNNDKIDKYFCLIKDEIDKLNNTLEMKLLYEMNIAYYLEKNDIKCLKMINDYFKLTKF
ncbi:MAG: tetratricopeptide repeat protein, partial [Anaeroplasmataceae bacterium]